VVDGTSSKGVMLMNFMYKTVVKIIVAIVVILVVMALSAIKAQ